MAKKVYDEKINKNTDWGGDESTGGLPVAGNRVQEFIKEQLNNKAGVFHYDTSNNRYIVFADEENRDAYFEDPTRTELIIGTFDAPFNYSAQITLSSPTYIAILSSSKNNYIEFTFDTMNKSGQSVGEDVICTYTFIKSGTKKVVTEKYRYGQAVRFKVDDYLSVGTNTVTIGIVGQNTLAATTVGITYQVVDLRLSDTYDISQVYNLVDNPSAAAAIPYSISGYGTKVMEWYLDGKLLDFVKVEDEMVDISTTRTKYISLANLSQGIHSLQYRAYTMLDGEKFYSDILYRDLMVYTGAGNEPIIAVSAVFPVGSDIITTGDLQLYGIQQYIPYDLVFAVYNSRNVSGTEAQVLLEGKVDATVITHNNEVSVYSLRPLEYGVKSLVIRCGNTEYPIGLNITKSSTTLEPIVNGLVLDLQSIGKTNNDADREKWAYGDYSTQFTNFVWNRSNGWIDNRLLISNGSSITVNYAPFTPDPTTGGRTLEFEFETRNVLNDEAVICNATDETGTGVIIKASEVILQSAGGSKISTRFKSNENIRISLVINPKSGTANKLLAFIYVDGIWTGAVDYSPTDSFLNNAQITFASIAGEVDIALKSIRAYNGVLSSDQILNNYILYRDDAAEMLTVYDRNNIYEEGTQNFSVDKLAAQCPVFIFTGDIPALENTTDKNKTIYVDVEYINMQDPSRSFTGKGIRLRPQGTSSMGYPKKNYRPYTGYGTMWDNLGNIIKDGLYSFAGRAKPVNVSCLKADYAESSGTHNTGIARLWNQVMTDTQLNGEYVLRTEAQKAAIAAGYPYDVRTTVDGFPVNVFYRLTEDSELIYMGKYNFNNDKSTESVFGYRDIPGFDNSKVQCWEVLNNGNHLALFQDMDNFDTEWDQAFEARYPDKSTNVTDLKAFCEWVVSTKNDVEKFKAEKWDHLDVYKVAAYYIYLMRFGAVDQVVKNAMMMSEDGMKFFFINYDNDTVNGLRNDGLLIYNYDIDRQTVDTSFSALVYAYAGHESTLWNNLEADDEFMRIVSEVDNALYIAGLSYEKVIDMFDNKQAGKWCERVYNQDAQYKYIGPYTDSGINNLFMLQGKRSAHRRWWLSHRFDLYDSKYVSGAYKAKSLEFKAANAPAGINFTITAGNRLSYGYGINNVPVDTGISLDPGETHTFTSKQVINVGDPVRIYSAVNLEGLDVHEFMQYLSTINISEVLDTELGTRFKKLVMGLENTNIDSRRNTSLYEISGLSRATMLEYLNIAGYKGITSLDLSGHYFLNTLKAYESGLTGVAFANGGLVRLLELPETLQAFSFENLNELSNSGLKIAGNWSNISSISIKNCPRLSMFDSLVTWYDNKTTDDSACTLVLEGINWTDISAADLIRIGNIKTAGGTFRMTGSIRTGEVTSEQVSQLMSIFGNNCFTPESELYIKALTGIFLAGPAEVLEGEEAYYTAVVFSEFTGKITYFLISDYRDINIDASTGKLTTNLYGSDRTLKVGARFIDLEGGVSQKMIDITIKARTYPNKVVITGQKTIETAGNYDYVVETYSTAGEVNGEYLITYDIVGTAVNSGKASIMSKTDNGCTVSVGDIDNVYSFTIRAYVKSVSGRLYASGEITVSLTIEGVIATESTSPQILSYLKSNGLCATSSHMTREEAQAITALPSSFPKNTNEDFSWFKEFIGIIEIGTQLQAATFSKLELPPTLLKIGENALREISLTEQDTLVIPESVKYIKGCAFYVKRSAANKLTCIIFPEEMEEIDFSVFSKQIKRVKFPKKVTKLGSSSFIDTEFDEVIDGTLPMATKYDSYCFQNMKYAGNLVIPEGVETLGSSCFENATIGHLDFPSTLKIIYNSFVRITTDVLDFSKVAGDPIFYNSSNMHIREYIFPRNIRNSSYLITFEGSSVEKIIFPKIFIPSIFREINQAENLREFGIHPDDTDHKVIDGVLFTSDGTTLVKFPIGKVKEGDPAYIIPSTVETIEERAFTYAMGDISFGDAPVRTIGTSAFKYSNIKSVDLSNVTAIYSSAFENSAIESVILPTNLNAYRGTSYGSYFSDCKKLKDVSNMPREVFYCMFQSCSLLDANVNDVKKFGAYCFNRTAISRVILNDADVSSNSIFSNCNELTVASIINPTTKIGDYFFRNCTQLSTVEISKAGDLGIGTEAFSGCTQLHEIRLPQTTVAPTVKDNAFGNNDTNYAGMDSGKENILYAKAGATGFDTGQWLDPLQNPDKCNFTISLTL